MSKITKRQRNDMNECENSVGTKDCFECSANVCLMKYEHDLNRIEEYKAKAAKWDDSQTQADLELAAAVKAWFVNENGEHSHFVKQKGDSKKSD